MNRFFLPLNSFKGDQVSFPAGLSHQIVQVLRMDLQRDIVNVINPEGLEYAVQLAGKENGLVQGRIIGPVSANKEPKLKLVLCFSLTRREKMELILQKCTELGVAAFWPYISSRSLVQDSSSVMNKKERLETIIREASEQAHRLVLPKLEPVRSFATVLSGKPLTDPGFFAWEEATLENMLSTNDVSAQGGALYLMIGPEGGFSGEEAEQAKVMGWRVISLGKPILRMETACIAASAVALYLGEIA